MIVNYLAIFRSRTEMFEFTEYMKNSGCNVNIVPTPSEMHIGCGLSASFSAAYLKSAERIISVMFFSSFYGLFMVVKNGKRLTTLRISF